MFRVLLPAVGAAQQAARRSACVNNLKQIGLALHNYHDVYGRFPAPSVSAADGKPMHSWRVAIVPFLISHPFYMRYDFNRPWDSPANLRLAKSFCPSFYVCPSANQPSGSGLTNYVMVVGPKAASRAGSWTGLDQITDGPANTVIIAEIADSDIFWSEPRDLNMDEMSFQINDPSKPGISSHHLHGAMVLFADGTVKFLDESTKPDDLRAMLTASAGDKAATEKER
ncbi:MAG TPA: DUF1559 domain-containing protein [Pirellulales bacterium]|nr:DUF1559 domain-containing protein [Pirellulales bacterium]